MIKLLRAGKAVPSRSRDSARPTFGGSLGVLRCRISLAIFPAPAQITGACVILAKRD